MKIIWIVLALLAFAIEVPFSIVAYKDYKVISEGHVVVAKLIDVSSSKGLIKFAINEREYDTRINRFNHFNYNEGDMINLRYLPGFEDHFLLATEKPLYYDILLLAGMGFCGIMCISYAIKNVKLFGES